MSAIQSLQSVLRGSGPKRRDTSRDNPVYYEDGTSWQKFNSAADQYFVTHCIPNNKSMFNPPLHLHLFQDEYFEVAEGTGLWHLPTHINEPKRQQIKRQGDEPIFLPKGRFHRFENMSSTEKLIVNIRIDPTTQPLGVEEEFFRNFFGYLEDCRLSKVSPSLFQLQLFLHTVDGPLAIPIPGPDWFKWWISRLFCLLTGVVIGEWLLGYQRSYPEYYRR